MQTRLKFICLIAALLTLASRSSAEPVTKIGDNFDHGSWIGATLESEGSPNAPSGKSMRLDAPFTGSFTGFSATPAQPLVIPGDVRTIKLHHKISDTRYAMKLSFRDGWNRESVDGKPLEWDLRNDAANTWQVSTFSVPDNWVRPIAIQSITTHNWSAQSEVKDVQLWLDHLEVTTDLAHVDLATGQLRTWRPDPNPVDRGKALKEPLKIPLLNLSLSTSVEGNAFVAEKPQASVAVRNWRPEAIEGKLTYRILDSDDKPINQGEQTLKVESLAGISVDLPAPRFGLYRVAASIEYSDGTRQDQALTYARIPEQPKLSAEQKLNSPYGLNYHGGGRLLLSPFRKAGIVWFREYAFSQDFLMRAKGQDGKYAGWPHFPRMMKAYADADAMVLACLQGWIKRPSVENGKVAGALGPNQEWTRNLAHVLLAFPQIAHWEMSNEYDLNTENARAEELVGWKNYQLYHEMLGELVDLLVGEKGEAVENGRAGVWPDRVLDCVNSGHFAKIGVINSHHYCGTDAPEVNFLNFNTGFEDRLSKKPATFFDDLRAVTRNAQADGKQRRHWLTEFGWDTKAGKVVSHYEQAVYLQRAWMLALAAGVDKAFWFFHFDSAEANNFFDGCGLLTHDAQPKLALSAMAGMTSILPSPKFVGSIHIDDNSAGYMFEQDEKHVAAMFSIEGDDGPAVLISAPKVYDYLGNIIDATEVKLSMAPTYAVGVESHHNWYHQTAYELETPHLELVTSGDPVKPVLAVRNNRQLPIRFNARLVLPEGWQADQPQWSSVVAPGEETKLALGFHVSAAATEGLQRAAIEISEIDVVKRIPLRLMVQPAMAMDVKALMGAPGPAEVDITIANRSSRARGGVVRLNLPASWTAEQREVVLPELQPGESRQLKLPIKWTTDWQPSEQPRVELDLGQDQPAHAFILPSHYRMHKAGDLRLDGDLSDWPAATEIPKWMLGSTFGDANARIHLAWSERGLYGAVAATDSKAQGQTPTTFWSGDVLELFIDTANRKEQRQYEKGDHQFWLVPMTHENRVYAGQWKRGNELAATIFDLPGVESAAKRTADGYTMEFLIPARQITNYKPAPEQHLGLNMNLTVQGKRSTREAYWPQPKVEGAANPHRWGTLKLVP